MRPIFADTSYFVALLSKTDQWHETALEWSKNFLGQQFVSEYVLVELGSALANLQDRHLFVPFVRHLFADPGTQFVPASAELLNQGLELFAKRFDKAWSLVDCLSFVIMKKRRLSEALTTDHHFEQAGFKALLRH